MKLEFNIYDENIKDHTSVISEAISEFKNSERFDFINMLNSRTDRVLCQSLYDSLKHKKNFVQIGIGGSSLGPEMLLSSLKKSDVNFFFLNNIDADKTYEVLDGLDYSETLFYVVSKSGGTAETMAQFAIVVNKLQSAGIKREDLKDYFVFSTDPVTSSLKDLGEELGITCLPIPSNVGGRFSVLTSVGLFPALFAGINIEALCESAYSYGLNLLDGGTLPKTVNNILGLYENGVDQTVLMPYSSKLRDFSFWFIQLWAESLGKKRADKRVGLTPIPSYGATDQHSQMQLFMEGPRNKLMFMVHVENTKHDFPLSNDFKHKSLEKLSDFSLKNLMDAEYFGTLKALGEEKIHHIHMGIEELNEQAIGEMIIFFEILTAVTGLSLKIDPFNQPGVEAGKIFSFEWLDKLKNNS